MYNHYRLMTRKSRDSQSSGPNVVWVTLDSVRADHTTPAGYGRETTPNLARIAAWGGYWFPTCYSHARWTPAATTSILTGTRLTTHGVGYDNSNVSQVPAHLRTVPQLLGDVGYRTAGFSSNGYVSEATGLNRGFERFSYPSRDDLKRTPRVALDYLRREFTLGLSLKAHHRKLTYDLITEFARSWMEDAHTDPRPSFLYAHYNDPHHPYLPPHRYLKPYVAEIGMTPSEAIVVAQTVTDNMWQRMAEGCRLSKEERDALFATYDACIRSVDETVGTLFEYSQMLPGETVFVVTGDHGELFGEGGVLGHNLTLHDGLTHVPMVVHGMDGLAAATDGIVQHADVMRTLVEYAGGDVSQFEGKNLLTERREYAITQRGPRHSDINRLLELDPTCDVSNFHEGHLDAAQDGRMRYQRSPARAELYELPDEKTDLLDHRSADAERFAAVLDALDLTFDRDGEERERVAMTAELEAHLTDMGYL
jgi:arylsulfatase A-like enzyme